MGYWHNRLDPDMAAGTKSPWRDYLRGSERFLSQQIMKPRCSDPMHEHVNDKPYSYYRWGFIASISLQLFQIIASVVLNFISSYLFRFWPKKFFKNERKSLIPILGIYFLIVSFFYHFLHLMLGYLFS